MFYYILYTTFLYVNIKGRINITFTVIHDVLLFVPVGNAAEK